jgi:outer membrane protein assembly factor BamB
MPHIRERARRAAARTGLILMVLGLLPVMGYSQVSVFTQHNDNLRDGLNASETVLTAANVNASQFGMLFKVAVDDQMFAQPLVDASVSIGGGTHSVVYVATSNNSVYAFDAVTGAPYWHVNLGTAFTIQDGGYTCMDILNTAGIMGTPVINPANNTLYVVAKTFINGVAAHKLHALNLSTGAEQAGSPVTIQASGFNSVDENERPALLLANGNIYFSLAGHCDQGSWKGFTFAYNATTLAPVGVFNASPSDNGNGIWESGNGDAADAAGNVYFVTGNGAWDGATNFSETMLKAGPSLNLVDWHTPSDFSTLDAEDNDLSSSGPLLLAGTNLMLAGGKAGVLNLVNTTDMGHLGDNTAVQVWPATSSHIHSLVYFNGNLMMWGQADFLRVYHFDGTTFDTTPTFTGSLQAIGHPGGALSASANGTSNGILWAATNSAGGPDGMGAWHFTEPGILYAYGLPTMIPLWNNEQNPTRDDCGNFAKFTAPTIANGRVYLASFGTASTNSGQLCVYGELGTAASTPLIPNGTYVITSVHSGQAIDDPAMSQTQGQVMQQWDVNNGTNQQWVVNNVVNNVITLTNVDSGQALAVQGGSTANSAPVVQVASQNVASQQWNVISVGNNAFELTNVNSGQALDVNTGSTTEGETLDEFPYQANPWQQWIFTKH